MINFKSLLETVYEPKSGDEKNFKDKHIVVKYKTPYDTESQFTSNLPKAKRKADHDKGEDENVYEAAEVHTKRADKQAVIVRAVDPKTGESKAKVVQRRAGEIKIGEEVEQIDELSDDKLKSYHAKAGADRLKAKAEVEKGMSAKKFTPASVQKTTDSYKRFIKRGKGMTAAANKMSEEVELEESISNLSNSRLKFHATKDFPHGSYTRKEIKDEHNRRMKTDPEYHKAKPSLNEESELDEKVVNPYAVGMAAAMKATGDRPPLKKSTIIKGHEIAKSIKKEAMDPVGKETADIDNDGDVDKSDNYLHNRRKAIAKALRKEDLDEAAEYTMKQLKKKFDDGTHEAMNDPVPGRHVELRNTKTGKRTTHYVKEDALQSSEANHKKYKSSNNAKGSKPTFVEDVEQIDEISKDTVRSYADKSYRQANTLLKHSLSDQPKSVEKASKAAFKRRQFGIKAAGRRLGSDEMKTIHKNAMEQVEMIDEAVKVGAMKLHDGSSVTITRAMADSLNNVLEQLNPMNRVKMEQKLHASKKDFDEILKFAENVNG